MNLYIDLPNLISFITSRDDEMYPDTLKLLKKQLDVYFNFSKSEVDKNELLLAWYSSEFTQGFGKHNRQVYDSNFPLKPVTVNSFKTFSPDQLCSIYLIDDTSAETILETGTILIGGIGNEIITLSKVFLNHKDYIFEKKWKIGGNSFKNWEDLMPYSLPLTDIIIVDSYITSDEHQLEFNIGKFLECLCKNTKIKINVIIYTDRNESIEYDKISKVIRASIKRVTGIGPNFTLITFLKKSDIGEHDRTIFSNYKRIGSGDTFNYFNSTGAVQTRGREIHYSSLANTENYLLAKDLLTDLQKGINFLNKNGHEIHGDKKSRFLNFD